MSSSFVFLLIFCLKLQSGFAQKDSVGSSVQPLNIGLMLQFDNLKKPQEILDNIVSKIDTRISAASKDIFVNISTHILTMNDNSISNVLALCEQFIQPDKSIHALIVSHPAEKPLEAPEALSYACEFYKIPIISISTQDPVYSEKALHSTFLRTVSPDIEASHVWADLLHDPMFRYSKVVLVYPNNYNGEQLYQSVINHFEKVFINISQRVNYKPGLSKAQAEVLLRDHKTPLRVYLFYGSKEDAGVIFSAALNVGMLEKGYFWLVSQSAASVAPVGAVFADLKKRSDVEWHLQRAVRSIYGGLLNFLKQESRIEPFDRLDPLTTCNSQGWPDGKSFFKSIRDQTMDPIIKFNSNGDPTYSEYGIFVKQSASLNQQIGSWKQGVGGKDSQIYVNEKLLKGESIDWIGGNKVLPEGVTIEGNLRIVTVQDRPFVFVEPFPEGDPEGCDNSTHSVCLRYDKETNKDVKNCCYGYCIQLLKAVSTALNFSYTLHLSKDGKFGNYKIITGMNSTKSERIWTGAIGELVRGEADAVFASMTIDHDRSNAVDFTNPYKPQGLSIAVTRQKPTSSLSSFVQPFHYSLWILIFISVHIVAFILYMLDRFSPFARSRTDSSRGSASGSTTSDDEDGDEALNLSSALWFAYGVLLNSGIGGTPRSFAARVLGMVWAGFAMIIVASYTANLAAYLVLERPESEISGINDARMRNPSETYPYGTVRDSSVENYFRRKVEMTNMYHFMQIYSHDTQEEALKALKDGRIQAFIWDSAQLDYETSRDCDLMMVGDTFQKSGLAVALQKDSPWTEKISLEILKMRETGEMEQLDRDWVIVNSCQISENEPSTLGIDSMAGIFITVAVGVILGGICMVIERVYYHHFDGGVWASEQQQEVARSAFEKWKLHTEEKRKQTPGFSTDFMKNHGKSVEAETSCHLQFSKANSNFGYSTMPPHMQSAMHNHSPASGPHRCVDAPSGSGAYPGNDGYSTSGRQQSIQSPTPPPRTSTLDSRGGTLNNRVVQFKPNVDQVGSASYVDV